MASATAPHSNSMKRIARLIYRAIALLAIVPQTHAANIESAITLKQPGNNPCRYVLRQNGNKLQSDATLPIDIHIDERQEGSDRMISVSFKAKRRVYFSFEASLATGFKTDDSEFFLPGFWYHRNLRSPQSAPSFHT